VCNGCPRQCQRLPMGWVAASACRVELAGQPDQHDGEQGGRGAALARSDQAAAVAGTSVSAGPRATRRGAAGQRELSSALLIDSGEAPSTTDRLPASNAPHGAYLTRTIRDPSAQDCDKLVTARPSSQPVAPLVPGSHRRRIAREPTPLPRGGRWFRDRGAPLGHAVEFALHVPQGRGGRHDVRVCVRG
jgi:hypothetical protein